MAPSGKKQKLKERLMNWASQKKGMGFWSIDKFFYEYIRKNFPDGSILVELGSGKMSEEFSKHYTVYSIEHDPEWVGKYNSNYIHAPIKDYGDYQWYDRDEIEKHLPKDYDFLLIDGPPKKYGRKGFLHNLDLFKLDIPLLFDDTNRYREKKMMKQVAKKLDLPYKIFKNGFSQCFSIVGKEFAKK